MANITTEADGQRERFCRRIRSTHTWAKMQTLKPTHFLTIRMMAPLEKLDIETWNKRRLGDRQQAYKEIIKTIDKALYGPQHLRIFGMKKFPFLLIDECHSKTGLVRFGHLHAALELTPERDQKLLKKWPKVKATIQKRLKQLDFKPDIDLRPAGPDVVGYVLKNCWRDEYLPETRKTMFPHLFSKTPPPPAEAY